MCSQLIPSQHSLPTISWRCTTMCIQERKTIPVRCAIGNSAVQPIATRIGKYTIERKISKPIHVGMHNKIIGVPSLLYNLQQRNGFEDALEISDKSVKPLPCKLHSKQNILLANTKRRNLIVAYPLVKNFEMFKLLQSTEWIRSVDTLSWIGKLSATCSIRPHGLGCDRILSTCLSIPYLIERTQNNQLMNQITETRDAFYLQRCIVTSYDACNIACMSCWKNSAQLQNAPWWWHSFNWTIVAQEKVR